MRVRKKKWTDEELSTNPKVIEDNTNYKGKWKEYFGNDNPIYLEIGCGKGRFISETSQIIKDVNFIALEREKHIIGSAARTARDLDVNLAFLVGDVKDLEDFFDEDELSRIYINFCDPWSRKRKWAKRRLTHNNFLDIYKVLLKNNCEIFLKTDNKTLFEFSLNEFSNNDWKLKNISLDLHNSDFENNIMTEYEEKFSSKGMEIFRLEAINKKNTTVK